MEMERERLGAGGHDGPRTRQNGLREGAGVERRSQSQPAVGPARRHDQDRLAERRAVRRRIDREYVASPRPAAPACEMRGEVRAPKRGEAARGGRKDDEPEQPREPSGPPQGRKTRHERTRRPESSMSDLLNRKRTDWNRSKI